jgi:hypothetical protein
LTFIAIHYGTTLKESVEDRGEAIRTALKELIRRFDVKEKTETQDESKRACHEHYLDGWKSDGTYTITASNSNKFNVYCDMKDGGWTLVGMVHTAFEKVNVDVGLFSKSLHGSLYRSLFVCLS